MECFCSFVHHTNNHQPFLHLVVMVTTLETPKNIFCGKKTLCRVVCVAGSRKGGRKVKMSTGGRRYHDPPALCALIFPLSFPLGRLPRKAICRVATLNKTTLGKKIINNPTKSFTMASFTE